jgi:hypothetical protein
VGQGCEEFVFAVCGILLFHFGTYPGGDVVEQHGHLAAVRPAEGGGKHVSPTAAQGLALVHEPDRLSSFGDSAVGLEPVLVMIRDELPDRLARHVRQPGGGSRTPG